MCRRRTEEHRELRCQGVDAGENHWKTSVPAMKSPYRISMPTMPMPTIRVSRRLKRDLLRGANGGSGAPTNSTPNSSAAATGAGKGAAGPPTAGMASAGAANAGAASAGVAGSVFGASGGAGIAVGMAGVAVGITAGAKTFRSQLWLTLNKLDAKER